MQFLKKKLGQSKARQENSPMSEGQANPYVKNVANIEEVLHEISAAMLTKPLRKQLQANRDERAATKLRRGEVIVEANSWAWFPLRRAQAVR